MRQPTQAGRLGQEILGESFRALQAGQYDAFVSGLVEGANNPVTAAKLLHFLLEAQNPDLETVS